MSLESRRLLSGTRFSEEAVVSVNSDQVNAITSADLDGDKDLDLLVASRSSYSTVWYENVDGHGSFGAARVISSGADTSAVQAADLDGDGDTDVVVSSYSSQRVEWFANVDGHGNFGSPRLISQGGRGTQIEAIADIDGDGGMDLLIAERFGSNSHVEWRKNLDKQGSFSDPIIIESSAWDVLAGDFDGDGDVDLMKQAASASPRIDWYANDGKGQFTWREQAGDLDIQELDDMDGDGDLDLLAQREDPLTGYQILWIENPDGASFLGPIHTFAEAYPYVKRIFLSIDIDQDADPDIVAYMEELVLSEQPSLVVYENLSNGQFLPARVFYDLSRSNWGGNFHLHSSDIDQDGHPDLVYSNETTLAWLEIRNEVLTEHILTAPGGADEYAHTQEIDFDGDGDIDLLAAWQNTVLWYENLDGIGRFADAQVAVRSPAIGWLSFRAGDVDGDGDVDVAVGDRGGDNRSGFISIYERLDNQVHFGEERRLHNGESINWISLADFDGDHDLDLAWNSYAGEDVGYRLAWQSNSDGRGQFTTIHTISLGSEWNSATVADIDRDGDFDLLVTSITNRSTGWFRNQDGLGRFSTLRSIGTTHAPRDASIADFDGDGDLDILVAEDYQLTMFADTDGQQHFGSAIRLSSLTYRWLEGLEVGDLDSDGDTDIVVSDGLGDVGEIAWYENDGLATFTYHLAYNGPLGPRGVSIADLDHDTDLDIIAVFAVKDALVWFENLLPHAGDANSDGYFDSADLVHVFQGGEYEDQIPGNSIWEEGDWNGDGDFDSSDLIAAFQMGLYERKTQHGAAVVPGLGVR